RRHARVLQRAEAVEALGERARRRHQRRAQRQAQVRGGQVHGRRLLQAPVSRPGRGGPTRRAARSCAACATSLAVMRLLLWDIDGTLVRVGQVGREVFAHAITSVVERDPGDHGVVMSGKTDPQIALEILQTMRFDETTANGHLPAVLARLEAALSARAADMRAPGRVLPGVREVLTRLDAEDGVVQSPLTGNIAPNAIAKLAAFDLDGWMDWRLGAFGSDHHDRRELVPIAVERMRELH